MIDTFRRQISWNIPDPAMVRLTEKPKKGPHTIRCTDRAVTGNTDQCQDNQANCLETSAILIACRSLLGSLERSSVTEECSTEML